MHAITAASQQIKRYFTPPPGTTLWRGRVIVCYRAALAVSALYLTIACIRLLAHALFSRKHTSKRLRSLQPHFTSSQQGVSLRSPELRDHLQGLLESYRVTNKTLDDFINIVLVPRGIKATDDLQLIFNASTPVLQQFQACHTSVQEHRQVLQQIRDALAELEKNPNRKIPGGDWVFDLNLVRQSLNCRYDHLIQITQKCGGDAEALRKTKKEINLTNDNWKTEVAKLQAIIDEYQKNLPNAELLQAKQTLASLQNPLFPEALSSRLNPELFSSSDLEPFLQLVFLHKYILQIDILLAWSENLIPFGVPTLTLLTQLRPGVDIFQIGVDRETLLLS